MNFRQQNLRQSIQFQHTLDTAKHPSSKIIKTKIKPIVESTPPIIDEPKPIIKETKPIEQPKVVEQPKQTTNSK